MASAALRKESPAGHDRDRLKAIIAARSFGCGKTIRLVSGVDSNFYFNMKPTMLNPEGAEILGRLIVERLASLKVDYVGGLEMGAVPIVSVVTAESQRQGKAIGGFFVRKKAKEHGAKLLVEGLAEGETLAGRRIAILEDVCTTGGSALKAIEDAEASGAKVVLVLALVDREEGAAKLMAGRGLQFEALFKAGEFIPEDFERLPKRTG
jgi:orotate phosphoribosyltransferase